MERIPVRFTSAPTQSYEVLVKSGLLEKLSAHFDFASYSKVIIISDATVAPLWITKLKLGIGRACAEIIIAPGEAAKNIATLGMLWSELQKAGADRKSLVCNLGGGVVTDIGGFAASTYMRGIDFIQIPTTLLAQVDASVGGKTGIDHSEIKNLVGSFAQPRAVVIDPTTLTTLSDREFCSGFAEILKHGVIHSANYFDSASLKNPREYSSDQLATLISGSVQIKAQIVGSDEKESGPRKLLNFGHTAGHALEAYFLERATPLLHGEAISLGMVAEAKMSCLAGICAAHDLGALETALTGADLPTRLAELPSYDTLHTLMLGDKKTRAATLQWVLPVKIGEAKYDCTLPTEIVKAGFEYLKR